MIYQYLNNKKIFLSAQAQRCDDVFLYSFIVIKYWACEYLYLVKN